MDTSCEQLNSIIVDLESQIDKLMAYRKAIITEIVTKDNQFARKPDPEAIYYLLDKYQIDLKEAMIVGDREIEILLGQKAKVKTCFYESGNREPELQADYRVKSLEEVLDIMNIKN